MKAFTVVGVPTTHPCRRGDKCTGRTPTAAAWCSEVCRRVDASLAALPRMSTVHMMTVTAETAVRHALPWLDIRAAS